MYLKEKNNNTKYKYKIEIKFKIKKEQVRNQILTCKIYINISLWDNIIYENNISFVMKG